MHSINGKPCSQEHLDKLYEKTTYEICVRACGCDDISESNHCEELCSRFNHEYEYDDCMSDNHYISYIGNSYLMCGHCANEMEMDSQPYNFYCSDCKTVDKILDSKFQERKQRMLGV